MDKIPIVARDVKVIKNSKTPVQKNLKSRIPELGYCDLAYNVGYPYLDFESLYGIACIFSQGVMNPFELTKSLLSDLNNMVKTAEDKE